MSYLTNIWENLPPKTDEWQKDITEKLAKALRMSQLYNTRCHLVSVPRRGKRPAIKVCLDISGQLASGCEILETVYPLETPSWAQ